MNAIKNVVSATAAEAKSMDWRWCSLDLAVIAVVVVRYF